MTRNERHRRCSPLVSIERQFAKVEVAGSNPVSHRAVQNVQSDFMEQLLDVEELESRLAPEAAFTAIKPIIPV